MPEHVVRYSALSYFETLIAEMIAGGYALSSWNVYLDNNVPTVIAVFVKLT